MITHLRGLIVEKQPTRLVVEVAGVGYELFIPLSSFDRLPASGETCLLLTYDHLREDNHQLFGFTTEDERRMFVLLMSVSGIGPRIAMSALSGMSVRDITAAVAKGDVKILSSISGIGKKTAERIVVELKDKISRGDALEAVAGGPETAGAGCAKDAVMALIALGYKQNEAAKMVGDVVGRLGRNLSVEEIIRASLGT